MNCWCFVACCVSNNMIIVTRPLPHISRLLNIQGVPKFYILYLPNLDNVSILGLETSENKLPLSLDFNINCKNPVFFYIFWATLFVQRKLLQSEQVSHITFISVLPVLRNTFLFTFNAYKKSFWYLSSHFECKTCVKCCVSSEQTVQTPQDSLLHLSRLYGNLG